MHARTADCGEEAVDVQGRLGAAQLAKETMFRSKPKTMLRSKPKHVMVKQWSDCLSQSILRDNTVGVARAPRHFHNLLSHYNTPVGLYLGA